MQIAIHTIHALPPSCLNRDEDGRPKTAIVGGVQRARVSSQCRKRAWRTSPIMAGIGGDHSLRTRMMGDRVYDALLAGGVAEKQADEVAKAIAEQFGSLAKPKKKPKKKSADEAADAQSAEGDEELTKRSHKEVVVYGREEVAAIDALVAAVIGGHTPSEAELTALPRATVSPDVALFGRMRADNPTLGVDGAVYVSPMLSTHRVGVQEDLWTSVDALSVAGAGGMGTTQFTSSVSYACVIIDTASLVDNLSGDAEAAKALCADLLRSVLTELPGAMQTRFAAMVPPAYARIEVGDVVYSLADAVSTPVEGPDLLGASIDVVRAEAQRREKTLGEWLSVQVWECGQADGAVSMPVAVSSAVAAALGE